MGSLTAIIAAVATSEYIASLSGIVRMILPAIFFVPFLVRYGKFLEWPDGLLWLLFTMLLIIVGTISSFATVNDEVRTFTFSLAIFVPFAYMAFSPDSMEKFVRWYVQFAALLMSMWVWGHFFISDQPLGPYSLSFEHGYGSSELNMLWPIVIALAKESRGLQKIWLWFLAIMTIGSVFLLFSRLFLFVTILGIICLLYYERKKLFVFVAAAVFVAILCIPSDVIHDYLAWYRYVDWESDSPRSFIWGLALESFDQRIWWGIGPGNARYNLFGMTSYYGAHNTLLTVALETGIIGALLIGIFEIYSIYIAFKLIRLGGVGPYYAFSIIANLAYSIVGDWHHKPGLTLLYVIILVHGRLMLRNHDRGKVYEKHFISAGAPARQQETIPAV